jgi:hypothetical protein
LELKRSHSIENEFNEVFHPHEIDKKNFSNISSADVEKWVRTFFLQN